jgi:F-type H+-transporting ATPase subunit b
MAAPPDETPDTIEEAGEHAVAEGAEAVHGHEVAAGTSEAAAHGEGGGLPQFEFEYWGGQIVWLLLIFGVLYFLLSRVFVPRLRKALDARQETISGALAEARRVQTEADAQRAAAEAELASARASAQRTAAEAKARAAAESSQRQGQEEAKLAQHLAQAEDRIRQARDDAMSNVRGIALDTAEAITEKLSGRRPSPSEIDAALARVQGGVA